MLAREPRVDHGCSIIARAYAEMSTMRGGGGMSAGQIGIDKIWIWADRHALTVEVANHLKRVVMAIDAIFLRRAASERPAAPAPSAGSAAPSAPRVPRKSG